ncbi:MAG: endonuclease III [Catalinimonas sp.]
MRRAERYRHFLTYFSEYQPQAETELHYDSAFQLLTAVVLSAQCTDKRVNLVTPSLFERFPTSADLATAEFDDLFPYIRSVSYPNNKTKHLLGLARMLEAEFGGEVPDRVEDLVRLPGVGRKTAHVVASVIFDQPTMAVDTHVFRVSKRLGLVNQNARTPLEVEKQLVRHIPEAEIARAHHWLILHGRYVCTARSPRCTACPLTEFCRHYERRVASTLS